MPYIFNPPTIKEGPIGGHRLFYFYTMNRGITVLKNNGVYTQVRYPYEQDIIDADIAYRGGYEYTVDDIEAADLTAAGYGSYLTAI